jgi:hypothetical protein
MMSVSEADVGSLLFGMATNDGEDDIVQPAATKECMEERCRRKIVCILVWSVLYMRHQQCSLHDAYVSPLGADEIPNVFRR